MRGEMLTSVILAMLAFLFALAAIRLLPEQVEMGPGQKNDQPDCVQVSLSDRGMPDCDGHGGGSAPM